MYLKAADLNGRFRLVEQLAASSRTNYPEMLNVDSLHLFYFKLSIFLLLKFHVLNIGACFKFP